MAPFTFRLEQILRLRKQLEEQAMQAFSSAVQARDATKSHIAHLESEMTAQKEQLCQPGLLTAAERWLIQEYDKALREDHAGYVKRLGQEEDEVDRSRTELIKKSQERELLDKLKEKQAARYQQEERLKEQRDYDETATIRFQPASF